MNAIEFVKQRGWERTCELVNECPAEMSHVGKCGFSKVNHKGFVCKRDLKVLVEAWLLVERFGGVFQARATFGKESFTGGIELDSELIEDEVLKKAIDLVEKCQ